MNRRRAVSSIVLTAVLLSLGACRSTRTSGNVNIGAILPLSGDNASFGITARNAYQIAEEDARQEGRTSFTLVYGDSKLDKGLALAEYGRLVNQHHVVGFIEATGSGIALALADMAARDQVPIISAVDTSPLLTSRGGPFFFRVVPSDAYSSKVLSAWAMEKGLKSAVLVFNQQNDWAVGFKNAVLLSYREGGGSLPDNAVLPVTDDVVDFNSAIATLQKMAPRAWFVGLMGRQAGLFVRQSVSRGIKGPFLGVDNLAQQEFVDAAGAGKTDAWFVLPTEVKSAAVSKFAARYRQLFQRDPDSLAFKAYDAYFVMLNAVETIKKSGQPVTGAALQRKLKATNFPGITGTIQFDQHNDLLKADYQRLTYDAESQKVPVQ